MPTSRPRIDGFTLVEMLVVLAIVALLGGVAIARLADASRAGDRAKLTTATRAALIDARATAIRTGAPTQPTLPDGAAIAADPGMPSQPGTLLFFVDGSASGGTITVKGRPAFAVDWLTGAIRDAA